MKEVRGKFGSAKIFTNLVEDAAVLQVEELLNEPFTEGLKIRMMPDIHAGKGCVVGTTMTIVDKVVPNLVGVDIGCGVYVGKTDAVNIDFEKLDRVIREKIPAGFEVRKTSVQKFPKLQELKCFNHINKERALLSLGTLGGGNHFIELAKDEEGFHYLLIHTGSRSLGLAIAKHYQYKAIEDLSGRREEIDAAIEMLKESGREREIPEVIATMKRDRKTINKDLAYLQGESMKDYLHDIDIAQKYAFTNRQIIADTIIDAMGWKKETEFQTIHNYIDVDEMILRKGAVSAKRGEKLVIPMNMRDGSMICIGKGNEDWNESAPHGAGRIMSRNKAREMLNMDDFVETMKKANIYTTSVTKDTLDEAPMAYKPMESIQKNIGDTVEIVTIIKPVYNFKASETKRF